MIPDLRFIIGAVTAVALLGFTLFGMVAAVHITHQSRVGPLEASRLLAYTPEFRQRIDVAPDADVAPDVNVALGVTVAPAVEEPFNPAADPSPVDVSQPGPIDLSPPIPVDISQPPSEPSEPPVQSATLTESADEPPVAVPSVAVTPVPTATPSETADVRETADVQSAPDVQDPPQDPPNVQNPPDVQHVGSIPPKEDTTETVSEVAPVAEEEPEAAPPKVRRARRAKRQVRRVEPFPPFAATGYPLFATTTTAVVDRPAKGFWPTD
jgi:hypothetical protein